jgi:hypothetical protein
MIFAELRIGQRFTNDNRLVGFYWTKMAEVTTGSGDIVNAVSRGGQFVFFDNRESVLLVEKEADGPPSLPQ